MVANVAVAVVEVEDSNLPTQSLDQAGIQRRFGESERALLGLEGNPYLSQIDPESFKYGSNYLELCSYVEENREFLSEDRLLTYKKALLIVGRYLTVLNISDMDAPDAQEKLDIYLKELTTFSLNYYDNKAISSISIAEGLNDGHTYASILDTGGDVSSDLELELNASALATMLIGFGVGRVCHVRKDKGGYREVVEPMPMFGLTDIEHDSLNEYSYIVDYDTYNKTVGVIAVERHSWDIDREFKRVSRVFTPRHARSKGNYKRLANARYNRFPNTHWWMTARTAGRKDLLRYANGEFDAHPDERYGLYGVYENYKPVFTTHTGMFPNFIMITHLKDVHRVPRNSDDLPIGLHEANHLHRVVSHRMQIERANRI